MRNQQFCLHIRSYHVGLCGPFSIWEYNLGRIPTQILVSLRCHRQRTSLSSSEEVSSVSCPFGISQACTTRKGCKRIHFLTRRQTTAPSEGAPPRRLWLDTSYSKHGVDFRLIKLEHLALGGISLPQFLNSVTGLDFPRFKTVSLRDWTSRQDNSLQVQAGHTAEFCPYKEVNHPVSTRLTRSFKTSIHSISKPGHTQQYTY